MHKNKKLKCVFFGTPEFAVPSLDLLINHPNIDLIYVVSMPDRPSGRGNKIKSPEVIEFAKNNKIQIFQTENINKELDFINILKKEDIDLFVVLAFAQFLSTSLLDIPKIGCFNIHTSLLPKYRGAAPIQYALINGDKSTGVSIQKMVKKMDAGDIALSTEVTISENETGGQLYTRLKYQAALTLNELINTIINNKLTFTKQDEKMVSFAPSLTRDFGHILFKSSTYEDIKNKIRGLDPWPGTFCYLNNKRMKIFSFEESNLNLKAGEVSTKENSITIGCKDKTLKLLEIQLEGKKRCLASEIINGIRDEITIS